MEQNDVKVSPDERQMTVADAIGQMQGQGGVLSATVTITRKETGATETHQLIFTPAKE